MGKTAVIIGSTGLVGRICLNKLLDDPHFSKVISISRRPLHQKHDKLEELITDFENLDDYTEKIKGDVVFCCLGSTIKKAGSKEQFSRIDKTYPEQIAKAALTNGATHFLLISAMGANINSLFYYNKVKGLLEKGINNLGYKKTSIFRPSMISGERKEFRAGERLILNLMKALDFLFVGKLRKYKAIKAEIIAEALIMAAKANPEGMHIYESDKIKQLSYPAL